MKGKTCSGYEQTIASYFSNTGAVLVLHRLCLHPDRPALCGRAGASSGILLRCEYTMDSLLLRYIWNSHLICSFSSSSQHPVKTYGYAFFFSLTGYFGISFVLALIKLFGALVAVTGESISCQFFSTDVYWWVINSICIVVGSDGTLTVFSFSAVTTGRKAMTIVLSFMFFTKPFTFQ